MTIVKICGVTSAEDAVAAATFGADAIGFVLWPDSPRYASLSRVREIVRELPPFVTPVGVFVSPTESDIVDAAEAGVRIAQIHGVVPPWSNHRKPLPVLRAVHLVDGEPATIEPAIDDATVLLDARDPVKPGGTGRTIDWTRARVIASRRRVVLAGGLTPANVRDAIQTVRPYAVDVASGVEVTPGIKDEELLRRFIAAAKERV